MINAEESRQGVTLLQFMRVIPPSAWLRASVLWADGLAAIWPMSGFTPFSPAQEQSLQEAMSLLDAGLFEPKFISDLFSPMIAASMAQMLDEAESAGTGRQPGPGWEDGSPAAGPSEVATGSHLARYNPDTFIYPDKLPYEVTTELTRRNLITPRPGGGGYDVASADILDQLLAIYARLLEAGSDGRLLPDVEEPGQARRIAAPLDTGNVREALVLTLRGATRPDLQTDFQRFIDFRANGENERARRDYIEQLTGLWAHLSRGGPEHAREQIIERATADFRKARKSYFDRVPAPMLTAQALTTFGVVLPLAAGHPAAAVAGALATIGASVVTVAVRNDAPRYLRRATQSELLAPMAL